VLPVRRCTDRPPNPLPYRTDPSFPCILLHLDSASGLFLVTKLKDARGRGWDAPKRHRRRAVSFHALLAYSELRTPYIKKNQNRHKRIRSSEALILELGSGPRELHSSLSIMYSTRKSKGPCGPSRHRVCRARFEVGSVSDSSMILGGSTRTRHSHYLMSGTYLYRPRCLVCTVLRTEVCPDYAHRNSIVRSR
jgi:hypothetical protein